MGQVRGGALALAALVGLSGCVRRSLTIKTDPPGGQVYINDQLKGKAPLTYDFLWYGWHRVMIRKDGYERVDDRKLIRAPIYLWVPFDLLMELLPVQIRDTHAWSYTLTKAPLPPAPAAPAIPASSLPAVEPLQPAPPTQEPADEAR